MGVPLLGLDRRTPRDTDPIGVSHPFTRLIVGRSTDSIRHGEIGRTLDMVTRRSASKTAATTPSGPGARWVRAALQVNPFAYQGERSPSSKFKDEDAYNTALADKCEELGIELIAVTDHWCVDTARGLIDAATDRGITALPGFEANTGEAVHLLVIFEAATDFGDITAAIGRCGAKPGCENGTTGAPFKEILASMAEDGALVIPAHVNAAKAGLLHRMSGQALVNAITDAELRDRWLPRRGGDEGTA